MAESLTQEEAIFHAALQIDAGERRSAYLDVACANQAELRRRVEALLRRSEETKGPLDRPALHVATTTGEAFSEGPGTVIGPYKLLEQIGEGGFGVVYMAKQQQPIRRKVALKILKPGMDTRQVVARFEGERQALAIMDHPNIAKVHDGGATTSGRPYFVMELVKGVPITEFCDQNHLTLRQRLELFFQVCQAVQHAHQKGIIHRDLKPSNVLVTLQDGRPLVKVIDFGIAKALGNERLTDKTLFTGFSQMIGTPLYMSPEQAEMSGQDVDTRTDIYALGVLLYELLTGTTPFGKERLKEAGYDEIRRIICEEEPAKPSTRISTLGQAAATVSANRKSEPRRLSQLFRGELDWIVMKALEKDRNRRYETASGFAADVERYLHDEPVQACPPSPLYRFRKFARRNKTALLTASVIGCTLLLGVIGLAASTVLVLREKAQTDRAKEELEHALERERLGSYYQRIALAEREWSANNLGGMEQLLDACPTNLRGWEWHYLKRLRYKRFPVIEHAAAVLGLAVSRDGERIASSSQDGIIEIWDAKTGRELRSILAHKNHVCSIAFSPDGQTLASGSWDGTVKLWDVQTGKERNTLTGHHVKVWSVAFSPDGKLLASGGGGGQGNFGELKLWNAVTGQEVRSFGRQTGRVYCVAFSPDGTRLAGGAAGHDRTIKLWDVRTGQELLSFPSHHYDVMGLAFNPDGSLLASCAAAVVSSEGELKIWDATTGKLMRDLHKHTHGVWGVAFSPDGHRLASASSDQTVKIWDMASGQEALTLRGHVGAVHSVVFSPDGHRLFSCGGDGTVRVWDATPLGLQEEDSCVTLRGHKDEVTSVAFHPQDSAVVASASIDGTVKLWDTRTRLPRLTLRDPTGSILSLAFSPDGRLLATVGHDKSMKIWDTQSRRLIQTLSAPDQRSGDVSVIFLQDGGRVASAGWDTVVRIWDIQTGQLIHLLSGHNWVIRGLAASTDTRHIASVSLDGTVRLWDVESDKEAAKLPLPKRATGWCVALSPDGQQLAWSCVDQTVRVWNTAKGKLLPIPDSTGVPKSLAFSPDGESLAWGGTDATVKIWQASTGEIHVLRGHTNWVHSVAFSPDGKQIASASADRTVKLWPLPVVPATAGKAGTARSTNH